jgi:hypothetical protein
MFGDGRTGRDFFDKGAIVTLQFFDGLADLFVVGRLRSRRRIFQGRQMLRPPTTDQHAIGVALPPRTKYPTVALDRAQRR